MGGFSLDIHKELRGRYFRPSKAAKSRMLDEFTQITVLYRKAAIRLLHRTDQPRAGKRHGRPKQYGPAMVEVLKTVWEASDRLCFRRLQPFIFEMVNILVRHGELHITAGMGFAALETVGYGLLAFTQRQGSLGSVEQTLLLRGLLSPAGHVAWTGLVCAVLWRERPKP